MKSNKILSLLAATATLATAQIGNAVTFEELTHGYDVFVEKDTNLGGVRIHGSLATGEVLNLYGAISTFNDDNVTGSDYQVVAGGYIDLQTDSRILGDNQVIRVGTVDVPVGGGTVTQTVSGNRLSQDGKNFDIANGQTVASITSDNGIDFASSFSALSALSETFKMMTPTLIAPVGGDLLLDFSAAAGVEVMNISAANLNSFGQIKEAAGAAVASGVKYIINVDLAGFVGAISNPNQNLSHSLVDNVIWNFYGADSLEMGKGWRGSILATGVDLLESSSSDIFGAVVAQSFTKNAGEVHPGTFDYEVPNKKVPDTGATLMLMLFGALPMFFLARRRRA